MRSLDNSNDRGYGERMSKRKTKWHDPVPVFSAMIVALVVYIVWVIVRVIQHGNW